MARKNLIGQRFGKLTVIELIPKEMRPTKTAKRGNHWLCKCECGNTVIHYTSHLTSGDIQSCGCLLKEKLSQKSKDETGNKYGKLTVINRAKIDRKDHIFWNCQCECGTIVQVNGAYLRSGHTKSCGCVNSWGEADIAKYLSDNNIKFVKEYSFKDLKIKNPLRFDFAIFDEDKLLFLLEYQGRQHYNKEEKFYKEEIVISDKLKKEYCSINNILLYEIKYNENVIEKLNEIFNHKEEF